MRTPIVAFLVAIGIVLTGCSEGSLSPNSKRADGSPATPSFSQFPDIPIPDKASMDVEHTLLLGQGDGWLGRLVYTTRGSPASVYDLYKSDMAGFGWQPVALVRGAVSVQTWQRGDRVATVQIRDTLFGQETSVTVAPAVGMGATGFAPPSPRAAPAPTVTSQPLR